MARMALSHGGRLAPLARSSSRASGLLPRRQRQCLELESGDGYAAADAAKGVVDDLAVEQRGHRGRARPSGASSSGRIMFKWFSTTTRPCSRDEALWKLGGDQSAGLLLGRGALKQHAGLVDRQPPVAAADLEIGLVVLLLGPEDEAAGPGDRLGPDQRIGVLRRPRHAADPCGGSRPEDRSRPCSPSPSAGTASLTVARSGARARARVAAARAWRDLAAIRNRPPRRSQQTPRYSTRT